MKKALLYLLLFTTFNFYAQVSDITHCAGDTSFDLTIRKSALIGNLNPAETIISYHPSLDDATNNTNLIINQTSFVSTGVSKTIYARIDNNGTITTNYFNLIVNPVLTADATIKYVNCIPTINITGSGGNSSYEYSQYWINGIIYTQNNVITNPSPGSHTVSVRDGNGCIASKSLVVESLSPLTWIANTMDPVSCQGSNDGIIQITGSGGKAPYLYSIGNGNEFTASNVFKNLDVGNYTLKIQDSTGCIISFSLNISQRYPSIAVTVVTTNDSNSTNEGKIDLIVSGGTAPYTYSLKDSNEILIPSKTTNPFTGLAVGSYEAVVTDSKGCTSSQKGINILNTPTPLTTTAMVTPITCIITTGTITITPNGGTLPYQYSIDNGNAYTTSNVFSNLVPGTYNIKVLDAQNSVVSAIAIVNPINLPEINTTIKNLLCHGDSNGSILIGASGGKSPNVFSINGGPYTSYNRFENLSAGNYTASVKDSNGCIVSQSVVVSAPPPITFNVKIKDRTVTVDATGGDPKNPNNYALDGGNYTQGNVFSNVSYGSHVIYVKTINNCMSSTSIEVTVPLVSSVAIDKGTITATATGGTLPYNYSLQDPSGMPIITAQSSNTFTEVVNGSYTIVVTDSKGNTSVQANINISESSSFTATATINPITCINPRGIITVIATGAKSLYQYSLDYGLHYRTSNVFSDLTAGSYTITVRDSRNFITVVSATVTSAKPVLVSVQVISDVSCNGGSDGRLRADVTQGQAPYVYLLDDKESQISDTFNNLYSGVHTIKVTDNNNCTATVSFTISEPTAPINSTIAANDKSITASTTGGTPPYTYSLYDNTGLVTGPQTSDTFNNLPTGLYSLQTIDARGCSLLQNDINISELPLLSASVVITPINCDNSTGTIVVVATGGTGSYVYSLDNDVNYSASNIFSNLSPGNYIISVKDSQNSTASITATINPYNPLLSTAVLTKKIDCSSNASINITASGGKKPYQYSLDNGFTYTTNNTFSNINVGTYTVRVKDSLDCIAITNSIVIEQLSSLTATASVSEAVNCGDKDTVTITATGGQGPYVYSFNGGTTFSSSNISNTLTAGTWTLMVRDSNICYTTLDVTIPPPPAPINISTFHINATSANSNDGSINIIASGGTAPYSYSLMDSSNVAIVPAQASDVFTNLAPGTYVVIAKDAKGCPSALTQVTISAPSTLAASAIINPITCVNPGMITITAIGGSGNYQYSIDNGINYSSSNVFTVLEPGNYIITVKDSQNGIFTFSLIVAPVNPIHLTATIVNQASCSGPGTIAVTVTGGQAPYVYSIDNGPYVSSNTFNVNSGGHTVFAKDSNGCIETVAITLTEPSPIIATFTVENHTITINATGGNGNYSYGLDGNGYQTSTIFTNVSFGDHQIFIRDQNGCIVLMYVTIAPPAPLINGSNVTNQNFTRGQTLADLVIPGENIKWYSTQNASTTKKLKKVTETPLPLTTVLMDNTTYYASQTVNGIESTERLAVTVKLGTLGTDDLVIKNFTYYPNPVKNVLMILNDSTIDEATFISIKGQTLLTKKINNLHSEIDLSNFSKGVYFLKVKSGGVEKTVKLIKE